MESSAKTKASTPLHRITHPSPSLRNALQIWYNLHSYLICQRGRISKGLVFHSQVSVFGDSCQRGRKYEPKAKGPHHHHHRILKIKFFKLISYCVQKGEKVVSSKLAKPSWTLRGEFYWGGVLFKSKEKHLKQGEKNSNLENASFNLIHVPLTICKRFLKRILRRICKNKTFGANEVQNFK
jgi:hypothetical protein